MTYRPRIIVFFSFPGGVGKTTLATSLSLYLSKAFPTLLVGGDVEKNDTLSAFGVTDVSADWAKLALGEVEPPVKLLPRLYAYGGKTGYELHHSGRTDEAHILLFAFLYKLPVLINTYRLAIGYVVVDTMMSMPLKVEYKGRKLDFFDLLKKIGAKFVYVMSYAEYEEERAKGSAHYRQYADVIVLNKVPPPAFKSIGFSANAVVRDVPKLWGRLDAFLAVKELSRNSFTPTRVNVFKALEYILS